MSLHSSTSLKNKIAIFLECKLDCNSGALEVAGNVVNAEPLVYQFLILLIRHQGEVVSKQKIIHTLWRDKTPTDEAIRSLVKKTRDVIKDKARNPTYIKTIPTKGYVLIAPVELKSSMVQSWTQKYAKLSAVLGLVLVLILGGGYSYFRSQQTVTNSANEVNLIKRDIGRVYGNNMSTFTIHDRLKNISVGTLDAKLLNHLIIDDIELKKRQTIAFDYPLYPKFWWSNGSQRGLVMRSDRMGFYTLQFNRQKREPFITEQSVELPTDTALLAFDFSGQNVIVRIPNKNYFALLQLSTGEYETSIFTNSIQLWIEELAELNMGSQAMISDELVDEKQSQPNQVNEQNAQISRTSAFNVNIWPSLHNEQIMVGAQYEGISYFALYANLNSDQAIQKFSISGQINSALWSQEGERFSFTDNNANLYSWQVGQAHLSRWNTDGESINRIVADCGSDCFVLANTQDLPKLSEIDNPFKQTEDEINSGPNIANNRYAQVIFSNTIDRNESMPVYSQQGVYFISQLQTSTAVMFADTKGNETTAYQFKEQVHVDELAIDDNAEYLAGIINRRPFILNVDKKEFNYLSVTMPFVSNVAFNQDGNLQFYASMKSKAQNHEGIEVANANIRPSGLYEYSIKNATIALIKPDIKFFHSALLTSKSEDGEITHKAVFSISDKNELKVEFEQNKVPAVHVNINIKCMNCWHISGNYLYQLSINKNADSLLVRTHLLTGEQQKHVLAFDTLLGEFDLQTSTHKVMLTTRQNLQTKLVEIKGLKQIY